MCAHKFPHQQKKQKMPTTEFFFCNSHRWKITWKLHEAAVVAREERSSDSDVWCMHWEALTWSSQMRRMNWTRATPHRLHRHMLIACRSFDLYAEMYFLAFSFENEVYRWWLTCRLFVHSTYYVRRVYGLVAYGNVLCTCYVHCPIYAHSFVRRCGVHSLSDSFISCCTATHWFYCDFFRFLCLFSSAFSSIFFPLSMSVFIVYVIFACCNVLLLVQLLLLSDSVWSPVLPLRALHVRCCHRRSTIRLAISFRMRCKMVSFHTTASRIVTRSAVFILASASNKRRYCRNNIQATTLSSSSKEMNFQIIYIFPFDHFLSLFVTSALSYVFYVLLFTRKIYVYCISFLIWAIAVQSALHTTY